MSIYPTIGVSYDRMGLGKKFGKKLRDKANLSTKAKRPVPSLAFVRRFHCTTKIADYVKSCTDAELMDDANNEVLFDRTFYKKLSIMQAQKQ